MNYGMRCHDICAKGDIDSVFQAVEEIGVGQIQLALGKSIAGFDFNYGHYSPGLGRMIGEKLEKHKIHVSILGCYINPVNPDEAMRQAEVRKFIEHLKYARKIGADMVGTETGRYDPDFKVTPYTYTEGCYQLLLKSMREIVAAAECLGVTVGIEAVHDHTLYCPEIMGRFLEDINSPNVEAILDPVNLISSENYLNQDDVIDRTFAIYGDKITMVHMKDFNIKDGQPVFAGIGDGLYHYENLMRHLKAEKPYITMLLEESNKDRYHSDVQHLQKIYEKA